MDIQDQIVKIQKTASTLFDLQEHSDVVGGSEIGRLMVQKTGIEWPRISVSAFSAFPVSRFHTNHSVLEFFAKKYGSKLQIIELGAGFTPHFLNLKTEIGKYIEVDLETNSELKKQIMSEVIHKDNLVFIAGDILEESTWGKIKQEINTDNPVVIFSEGVISQYFDDEQKMKIASLVKNILVVDGSCIIFDDTLRNHPELHDHSLIKEGMSKIVLKSGSDIYKSNFQTFDQEVEKWRSIFADKKIALVDYFFSKPEMDFAVGMFKLIICVNDASGVILQELSELSNQNKLKRVWK
jgi:hypothetical protein